MKRLQKVVSAVISDEANATLFGLKFTDGTEQAIEVLRDDMPTLLRKMLKVCEALGARAPNTRPLPESTPEDAVQIPAEDLAVRRDPSGALWLMFRAGSHDLAVKFAEPGAAKVLAHALLNPTY